MRLRGVEKDDMLQMATYRSLQPTACRDAICSSRRFSVTYAPPNALRQKKLEAGVSHMVPALILTAVGGSGKTKEHHCWSGDSMRVRVPHLLDNRNRSPQQHKTGRLRALEMIASKETNDVRAKNEHEACYSKYHPRNTASIQQLTSRKWRAKRGGTSKK